MSGLPYKKKTSLAFLRITSSFICALCFVWGFYRLSHASPPGNLLPQPGALVRLSENYRPPCLLGIKIHPDDPLRFDFIVSTGDDKLDETAFRQVSDRLIRYFLTSLTLPEQDLWVNLSPREQHRIIPDTFARTKMGRDLLAQDYLLKQLSSSLIHPDEDLGREFWDRVHARITEKYGTVDIPVNTFNKIWIIPETAEVQENGAWAFVTRGRLKVMLEEDLKALTDNWMTPRGIRDSDDRTKVRELNAVSTQVVREIVLPAIEEEVNSGSHFSRLRQIYYANILATWFKKKIKDSLLSRVYVDKSKVKGIDDVESKTKQEIYERYVAAYRRGVCNMIKEVYDAGKHDFIPKKFFSGGNTLETTSRVLEVKSVPGEIPVEDQTAGIVTSILDPMRPELPVSIARRGDIFNWLQQATWDSPDREIKISDNFAHLNGFLNAKDMGGYLERVFGMRVRQETEDDYFLAGFAQADIDVALRGLEFSDKVKNMIRKMIAAHSDPGDKAELKRALIGLFINQRARSVLDIEEDPQMLDHFRRLYEGEDAWPEEQRLMRARRGTMESLNRISPQASRRPRKRIFFINATKSGGGVAEMRADTVRLIQNLSEDGDLDPYWMVMDGHLRVYDSTAHIHNALHDPDKEDLTDVDRLKLQMTWIANVERMRRDHPGEDFAGDVFWVDDPQPVGMIPLLKVLYPDMVINWRLHVDTSNPTRAVARYILDLARGRLDPQRDSLLYQYLTSLTGSRENVRYLSSVGWLSADAMQVHMLQFAEGLFGVNPQNRAAMVEDVGPDLYRINGMPVYVMGPAINPLYEKNIKVSAAFARATRQWYEDTYKIPQDAVLVSEVSRFDPFKGPVEFVGSCIRVWERLRERADEGDERARDLSERIHFVYAGNLPDDNQTGNVIKKKTDRFIDSLPGEVRSRLHLIKLEDQPGKIHLNPAQIEALEDMGYAPEEVQEMSSNAKLVNALVVNVLQADSHVVAQFSSKEGFGLTVTEAMYKAPYLRPSVVVATMVGGITRQIFATEEMQTGIPIPYDQTDREQSLEMYRRMTKEGEIPQMEDMDSRPTIRLFADGILQGLLHADPMSIASQAHRHVDENYVITSNVRHIFTAAEIAAQNNVATRRRLNDQAARVLADIPGRDLGGILLDPRQLDLTVTQNIPTEFRLSPGILDLKEEDVAGFKPKIIRVRMGSSSHLARFGEIDPETFSFRSSR